MTTSTCELCSSQSEVTTYEVPRLTETSVDNTALLCNTCRHQIEGPEAINAHHCHTFNESIWSENPAVKVLAWRILKKLSSEAWAQDLLDQLYMYDDLLAW